MKKRILIFSLVGLLALPGIFMARESEQAPLVSHNTAVSRNLTIFNEIVRQLENTYVDSIRPDEAFEAAIGAMLNTVDPYTEYYPAEEKERLMQMTTGVYGGIGAMVMNRDGSTYISQPLEGTPSHKAGLKAGDKIIKIDSVNVVGKTSDFTTRLLKGEPGTPVEITVMRPYVQDSVITFNVVRERVQEKSVPFYGVIGGNTGYILLTSFMEKSPEEVKTALESFKANPAVENVVLDLRSNGGGLVESAIEILGFFLPRDTEVLQTKGKEKASVKTYRTPKAPIMPDMPLAILIDGGSASASEITAGAMQDLDRAILVGNRSFGKGLVQGTYTLPYDGLLKVTTAKYYIPSGRLIQALDYSHRNPDGSVARTPDSLTNEYATRNGRIVRDGGGLIPDTTVKLKDYSRLLYNLVTSNQIFDYATKFAAMHPSIAPAGEFKVTDEIYGDFVNFVDTAKVKNDRLGKTMITDLRKTAELEGYMTDSLSEALVQLEKLVDADLPTLLYNRRPEIEEFLGREIVGRYYLNAGETEFSLNYDEELQVARDILNDPQAYASMLKQPAKDKKEKASATKSNKTKNKKK